MPDPGVLPVVSSAAGGWLGQGICEADTCRCVLLTFWGATRLGLCEDRHGLHLCTPVPAVWPARGRPVFSSSSDVPGAWETAVEGLAGGEGAVRPHMLIRPCRRAQQHSEDNQGACWDCGSPRAALWVARREWPLSRGRPEEKVAAAGPEGLRQRSHWCMVGPGWPSETWRWWVTAT